MSETLIVIIKVINIPLKYKKICCNYRNKIPPPPTVEYIDKMETHQPAENFDRGNIDKK